MIAESNIPFYKRTFPSLLILLLCCLISWWPLTFHVFSLKNDALDYHLAIHYQVSESISNGYLPFWTPYLNFGYPLHGDMQSGVWNPIVQIISLFGPYTLKTLQYEFLFFIYLSGVGMFFLVKHFIKNNAISLLAAGSYMLSGYITDSAQFLNWISAASFLPFVVLFYYRTIVERKRRRALACGIFYFFLFVSGYPADFILVSYLLLIMLIWYLFPKQNRSKQVIWQLIRLNALIAICFLLLSLPAIISYAEFLPLTQRGSGATYDEAMRNYLHPALIFSFLTPLPVWKASFVSVTDPLERSCYLGIITFALLLTGFFIKSNIRIQRFFKWGLIVSLLFSFGPLGGLRVASYYLLPLMNTFRHPANARLFIIFFGCLLAACSLSQILKASNKFQIRRNVFVILITCYTLLLIWSLTGHISLLSRLNVKTDPAGVKLFLDSLSFSDLLFFNIVLQVPFLAILYRSFVKKINLTWLLAASLVNSIIHTALYQPFSAIKKDSVHAVQTILESVQQKGYPVPDLTSSLASNSENAQRYFDEIGPYLMYSKKIGRVDYNFTPSNLKAQNEFWLNEKVRDILLQYPFFYKVDTVMSMADSSRISLTPKKIVLAENVQIKNSVDTGSSHYTAIMKKFMPLEWLINVRSDKPGFYCIFQNYYPRWELLVDGRKEVITRCNISFMGFSLPAGDHSVVFKYRVFDLKVAFVISFCTLLSILVLLFATKARADNY